MKWFTRKFPYYAKMEEVCNPGRGPRGAGHSNCFTQVSQAPVIPIQSGSGSSDEPEGGSNEGDTVEQPTPTARNVEQCTQPDVQSSDGTIPTSGGSSSHKRKSSDDGEENLRGNKSRLRPRDKFLQRIAEVGEGLLSKCDTMSANMYAQAKKQELVECFKKMETLKIEGAERIFCLSSFDNDSLRAYFLHSNEAGITRWFRENNIPSTASTNIPSNNPHANYNIPQNNPHASYNIPQNNPPASYNIPQNNPQFYTDLLRMNDPNASYNYHPDIPPQ